MNDPVLTTVPQNSLSNQGILPTSSGVEIKKIKDFDPEIHSVRRKMKINILSYSAWWKVEASLNKRIPGDQDLPDFGAERELAEEGITSLLALRGTKDKDWEVPLHHHRCAVIWAYIYNPELLNDRLFSDLNRIIPASIYPWYVQLECYTSASKPLGSLIIFGNECYLNAEDPMVLYLSDLLGISPTYARWRKIWSKMASLPDHIKLHYTVKRALSGK